MTSVPSTPQRHQRKRVKGWRMPDGVVYVGRPTRWSNPYRITSDTTRLLALILFRQYITYLLNDSPGLLEPLRGRDLACWCPLDKPCHADVLLKLANL